MSISSLNSLAAMAARPVGNTTPVQPVQRVKQIEREDQPKTLPQEPVQDPDEYTQAPPKPSAGLYYVGQDEEGQRQIFFDAPSDTPNAQNAPEDAQDKEAYAAPAAPKKADKSETLTTDTDKVDAEIRRLRNRQSELKQQVNQAANDPERQAELQKKLNQAENELRAKDNDAYRRQNAQYTEGTPF